MPSTPSVFAACLRGDTSPPSPPRRLARGSESLSAWDSSLSLSTASASLSLDAWAALDAATVARGAARSGGTCSDNRPLLTNRGSTLSGRSGRLMLGAPPSSPMPSSPSPSVTSTITPPPPLPSTPSPRVVGQDTLRPALAVRPPPSPTDGSQALVVRGAPDRGRCRGGPPAPPLRLSPMPPEGSMAGDGTADLPGRQSAPSTPRAAPVPMSAPPVPVTWAVGILPGSDSSSLSPPPSPSIPSADSTAEVTERRRRSSALRTPSDYDGLLAPAAFGRRVTVVGRRSEGFSAAVDGAAARLRKRRADASRATADTSSRPKGAAVAVAEGGLEASPSSQTPWAAAEAWLTPPPPTAVAPKATPPDGSPTASCGSSVTSSPCASAPSSPAAEDGLPRRGSAAAAAATAKPYSPQSQGKPRPAAAAGTSGLRFRQAIARRGVSLPVQEARRQPQPPLPLSPAAREVAFAAPAAGILSPPSDASSPDEWLDDYVSFMSEALRVTSTVRAAAATGGRPSVLSSRRGMPTGAAGRRSSLHRWAWWHRRWGVSTRA